ncbi:bifunctional diaminohydroxyphosphoribosylaminopyrimidine deaminase/5-amino-6-(5-phosphoribosylamino)uracil reductase [Effusibacillus lacus]|uniref:Riboflavin biosynthesis protein RibD n=1 Tax=Effusibacillus lacus TaxID=1348429 RepID=A0A292YSE4_9BACL|nr:diaminohydroxyphosphoribosylaminopyrimidine deaminase/5-amino-6-(5-phosphoribosylamino)uracil reductase [Effusibacillus lacus]GAX91849.1 bifunctional diaminohydroxyphosphoribosylaminopyrimidine deaminase/5-amino-6-(5-phosphoribosylamino)uracil reductase [Effusibacillus lacus]
MNDQQFMKLALQIASATNGRTWPNPMVGAVVVNNGQIVGMGAHLKAGEPHAEVHALNMAGDKALGATIYVTLEPCSHYGRTPPCADRVIQSGVSRVVIAMLDPNPLVAGQGAERIRQAGIEVVTGVLESEARRMNEVWLTAITKRRPFVWMKAAMTLDGKIAARTGDSKWITSESARQEVHRYRDQADAILVGIGTVLADDPQLTTRLPEGGRSPVRVILDTHLRIPESARVLGPEAPTILVCGPNADPAKIRSLQSQTVDVLQVGLDNGKVNLHQLLDQLYRRQITLLLVEGGAEVHGSFLDAELIDKVTMFVAPKLIGGTGPSPLAGNGFSRMSDAVQLQNISVEMFDNDLAVTGYPDRQFRNMELQDERR